MENASKALLIAGAVLIAILLISVGIMIYSGASGIFSKGSAAMSDADVQAFNTKWKNYEGNRQSAEIVNSMLDAILASNQSGNEPIITVTGKVNTTTVTLISNATGEIIGTAAAGKMQANKYVPGGYYEVVATMTNGVVSNLTVTKN